MRRESPIKRRNPSGSVVWVARYTGRDGKHDYAKPRWNRGKASFTRKAEAQRAIDEAYGLTDRPDTLGELLFPTPRGRLWRERTFYRDVWKPPQGASGLDIRPHECRHGYVTNLRAAGVNDADLADIAGHRVETMLA